MSQLSTFSCSHFGRRKTSRACPVNWLWAIQSATFDSTGSNDIGRLLFAISWSPSLAIGCGTTSAFFQARGKVLLRNEQLIRFVTVLRIWGKQSFITLIGTLSCPGKDSYGMLYLVRLVVKFMCRALALRQSTHARSYLF